VPNSKDKMLNKEEATSRVDTIFRKYGNLFNFWLSLANKNVPKMKKNTQKKKSILSGPIVRPPTW
jgi:hypothetical protein